MDVSSHSYIGFHVTKSDFVTEVDTGRRVCDNGHIAPNKKTKFCSDCGTEFGDEESYEPTEKFAAFAKGLGKDPMDLWEEWWPSNYWSPAEPDTGEVGFYNGAPHQCSEDYHDGEDALHLIIGVAVESTSSHRSPDSEPAVVTHDEITAMFTKVYERARALGMADRKVGLYTCQYISV